MDISKDAIQCRLCGVNFAIKDCKNIFEESTNLVRKIKETLPINISPDDSGSKYICLGCHNKVIFYYNFIQDVLKQTQEFNNTMQMKSLLYLSKQVTDYSNIHNDAIYTCPNCNVNLTILLVSDPQSCDYTFQISLAVVNHAKNYCPLEEHNAQLYRNEIKKYDININNKSNVIVVNNGIGKILGMAGSPIIQANEAVESKLKKIGSNGKCGNIIKETKSVEVLYNDVDDPFGHNYESTDMLIKLDPAVHNISWIDSEADDKERKDAYIVELANVTTEKNDTKVEDNNRMKSCPKITCKLCGARYLSQVKYEFHMERHRFNKIHIYACTLCDKEASSENLLWDHYFHTHKSLQRFACTECGKLFTKRSRLNGHQKSHMHSGIKEIRIGTNGNDIDVDTDDIPKAIATEIQGNVTVNCNLCGKLITDLDPDAINDLVTCLACEDSTLSLIVDGDEAKVISPRQYHCSKCPKHFVRKERLEFHEMRHSENMNEFVCSTCGKEFSAENSLYEHYLFVHKGARPHICELCGKSFQLKARLKEHHRAHTGERPYQCNICGQKCRTTNALKLHRKVHFSHSRYACNICDKSFSKKQNMNEHLEKHWKTDKTVSLPQLFTCPICVEDFPTYRMLKYHMTEIHSVDSQDPMLTKQKPWYECAQCHEKFKHQMSLKAHKEKVHEGKINPIFQCDICSVTYRIKQLLINHIKSKHNGEKRYKCAQCEKGFNDTKSLYNHILLHTGKKPFICEYCNMSFRRKDSRDHHRRKHTGEQPYLCPDCGESFSTYNSRSKHRKREHGVGDAQCPECGEKCNGQQEIRIHLNKHLGEKLKELQNIDYR